MKLSRISFLLLFLFLFIPSVSFAQSAAEKSWNTFWKQFIAAVKSKNKVAVKRLMSSEKDFMCCQEDETKTTRDKWLKDLDISKSWGWLQRQVAKGTKPFYNDPRRPVRILKDGFLLFEFIGGKWRFVGEAYME